VILEAHNAWWAAKVANTPHNQQPPRINTWHDIALADYIARFNALGPNAIARHIPHIPNWVLIKTVRSPLETLGVITRCLATEYGLHALPDWDHRVTFATGTTCFDALLGTQNAAPTAWMLVKNSPKWKSTVVSFTIFHSGLRDGDVDLPSMLMYVGRESLVGDKMRENEAFQVAADVSPLIFHDPPPHPFTPVYVQMWNAR
jgi:hypothetical protein